MLSCLKQIWLANLETGREVLAGQQGELQDTSMHTNLLPQS